MSTSTTEQRYESWKGTTQAYPTRSSIVPSNSRPSTNGVSENPDDYQSAFGTARPLKICVSSLFLLNLILLHQKLPVIN